jgi:hypothetical protein
MVKVDKYDFAVTTLSGERTKEIIKILNTGPKTMSEIGTELQDETDKSSIAYILSTLETHKLIKRDDYKPGVRDGKAVAAMSFVLDKEKLKEYVGNLRELTGFYENLL